MKTAEFDYTLPVERIAQTPIEPRDHSRLLVLNRATGSIEHQRFSEITNHLKSGDVMVINDSRVIPARLLGRKSDSGAKIDILLLNRIEPEVWEALAKPARRLKKGTLIEFKAEKQQDQMSAKVLSKTRAGTVLLHLTHEERLDQLGHTPLPPYIHTPIDEPERYQTVYALNKGSVAAPTAGLHFTPSLMSTIKEAGVEFVSVTLHVGLGSFRPVKVDDPREHSLHHEYCELGPDEAHTLNKAKREGRRIIGVGTTAVRTIEWATRSDGWLQPTAAWNDLFILPGYQFRTIDAMITNFHLPRSTLIMLVAAFAGKDRILQTYQEAIQLNYRFYSFGDAMLIL